ncbi:beta strand repeat-containing protein [Fibrella aquatilis]|uniref:DUF11 domain-containing protein n=1 Tax=Fibrella aquatilis TaxID=2817059 RepID=A0A939JZD9_9BACT|nr:DUF11 domain-containing protein [Fibrella aquatilis]MBO0930085.1 hypothetical protein [Fibrella aquatilis]
MKPGHLLTSLLCCLLIVLIGVKAASAAAPQVVKYKLTRDNTGTYRVYMTATASFTSSGAPSARITTGQVTVVVPTGTLLNLPMGTGTPTVASVANMNWAANTRIDQPAEDPTHDFISFGFSNAAYTVFNITANTDILLFSFTDNGTCPGLVRLHENTVSPSADLFQGGSTSTTPGNQLSILGNGLGNAYAGTYGSATNCGLGTPDLISTVGPVPSLTVGQPASLPVSLSNIGTASAAGPLTFTSLLPPGINAPVSFTSNGWGCTTAAQTVSCSNSTSLAAGSSSAFAIPITPQPASAGTTPTFSGTAGSASPDANTANNMAPPAAPAQPVAPAATTVTPGSPCLSGDCGTKIRYGLKAISNGNSFTYTVYMKSATAFTGINALVSTAQVTVRVPGTVTVLANQVNLQAGMNWAQNASVPNPVENPAYSYISLGYSNANSNTFVVGSNVEIPLFSFERAGNCIGDVGLWSSTDLLTFPNQESANVGNAMTMFGYGNSNAYVCNYTCPIACPNPVLALVKQAPPTIAQNVPFSYTFTVNNSGSGASSGLTSVVDVLPTGLQFLSGGGNGWSCAAVGQTVSCSSATPISAGGSSPFTLLVNPTLAGGLANSATLTGGGQTSAIASAPCALCPPGSTTSTVLVQPADLAIAIQQPANLVAGQATALNLTLTNVLSGVAAGPQSITLTLPAGVSAPTTFTAAGGWVCTTTGQLVVCQNPASLSLSQSLSLAIPITPSAAVIGQSLSFVATAAAASNETNLVNNNTSITTTALVTGVDLALSFGALSAIQPSVQFLLPVTIGNVGAATASGPLNLQLSLPAGYSLNASALPSGWVMTASAAGAGGSTVYSLTNANGAGISGPAGSISFSLPVVPSASVTGSATFSATVAPLASEIVLANNSNTVTAPVGTPDLSVAFVTPVPTFVAGQPATVPFVLTNVGTGIASGPLTTSITLPANFALNSFTAPTGWVLQSSTNNPGGTTTLVLVNAAGSLSAGQSQTISLALTAGAASGGQAGQIVVSAAGVAGEVVLGNNTTSTNTNPLAPNVAVNVLMPSSFTAGQPSSASLVFTNTGSAPYTGPLSTQLTLPPGATLGPLAPGWVVQSQTTNANGSISYVLFNPSVTLGIGSTLTLLAPITPAANVPGPLSVTVVTPTNPAAPSGGSTTVVAGPVPVQIPTAPNVSVAVGVPSPTLTVGQTSLLPITLTNNGNGPATGPISTSITLPAGLSLNPAQLPPGWVIGGTSPGPGGSTIYTLVNTTASIPASGGTLSFTLPITVSQPAAGTTPTITVVTQPTGQTAPGTGSYVSPSITAPNLLITIGQPSPALVAGQPSSIPLTLQNMGNGPASGPLSMPFTLPAGVSLNTAALSLPSGWTYTTAAGPGGTTIVTFTSVNAAGLGAGGSVTINVPVIPAGSTVGTTPVFSATIAPVNGQTTSATATMTTQVAVVAGPAPDLSISGAPVSFTVGQTSLLPVSILNNGNGSATGPITVQLAVPTGMSLNASVLPAGWSLASTSAISGGSLITLINNSLTIGAGATATLNVPLVPAPSLAGTTMTFGLAVQPVAGELVTSNNTNSVQITVPVAAVAVPDLSISGTPVSFTVGQTSLLPVTILNSGNAAAGGPLTIQVAVPTGLSLNAAQLSGGWSLVSSSAVSGGSLITLVNNSLTLSQGQSSVVYVPLVPGAALAGATMTLGLGVNAVAGEVNVSNNTSSVAINMPVVAGPAPDLAVSIPAQSFMLAVNTTSSVSFSVVNVGSVGAAGPLTLQFAMPAGFSTATSTFSTGGWGCATVGSVVSCTNASGLSAGGGSLLTMPVRPLAGVAGLVNPSFAINVAGASGETNLFNNLAVLNITGTVAVADLAVSFPAQSFTLVAGQPSLVNILVQNVSGVANAMGPLSLTLAMPTGFSASAGSFTSNGWVCTLTGTTVTATYSGSLSAGGSLSLTVPVVPLLTNLLNPSFVAIVGAVAGELNLANNISQLNYVGMVLPGSNLSLAVRVLLQGAFDPNTGLMHDKLRVAGLIPAGQPYGSLPSMSSYVFINSGTETVSSAVLSVTGTNAIVDWVMVELRSAANPLTVLGSKPGLLQRDGDVVSSVDGVSPLTFSSLAPASYFVVVRHRNHLGVMSAAAVPLSQTTTTYDFTYATTPASISATVYLKPGAGTAPQSITAGRSMLWAGNTNGDAAVIFQGPDPDIDPISTTVILSPMNTGHIANYIHIGYDMTDVNMDGTTVLQGDQNEVDVIFFNVMGHPNNTGLLANFIIQQHLP